MEQRLELVEAVSELQAELARAVRAGAQAAAVAGEVQFPVTGVQLEFHVAMKKPSEDWASVKFWVVEPGGVDGLAREEIHTVTVTLGAPVDLTGNEFKVTMAPPPGPDFSDND